MYPGVCRINSESYSKLEHVKCINLEDELEGTDIFKNINE